MQSTVNSSRNERQQDESDEDVLAQPTNHIVINQQENLITFALSLDELLQRKQRFASILNQITDPNSLIIGPMVNISQLPFRMLCREYGGSLVYSEMIEADKFVHDTEYSTLKFQSCPDDRPLIVQFAANRADIFIEAASLVQTKCDAVCLNLGCPLRDARNRHYGAYLCSDDTEQRIQLLSMIHAITTDHRIKQLPLFVKIRLCDSVEATVVFCRQLALAGVSVITIHARTLGCVIRRREGPADLDAVRAVKAALCDLPVIVVTNGNVSHAVHIHRNRTFTGADSVMIAESVMRNPAIVQHFCCPPSKNYSPSRRLEYEMSPHRFDMALRLVELFGIYPVSSCQAVQLDCVLRHVDHFAGNLMRHYQLDVQLLEADDLLSVSNLLKQAQSRQILELQGKWKPDVVMSCYLDEQRQIAQSRLDRQRTLKRQSDDALQQPNKKIKGAVVL